MKHCTLPTLLAVKTTILPTVPSSRAGQNSETGKVCIPVKRLNTKIQFRTLF